MESTASTRARTRVARRPRRTLTGVVVAVLGLALAVPAVLVPAQADTLETLTELVTDPVGAVIGVLDPVTGEIVPLTPPTPVIAPGGAGQIEYLDQVVCSSDGSLETLCDPVPLGDLVGVTEILLTAVPGTPDAVPTWSGCPSATDAVCTIPLTDLASTTPLAPVVTFVVGEEAPVTPDTRITAGPAHHRWVLTSAVTYRFNSTVEGSGFTCVHNGASSACDSGAKRLARLRKGSHLFTVAARAGEVHDPEPAVRAFHVPTDDRGLKRSTGWQARRAKGHFKNTFLQTSRKGATLTTRVRRAKRIVLVADRGRGHGVVTVSMGRTTLKRVNLSSRKARTRVLIPVKTFTSRRSGTVRIRVVSAGKVVRVDGLGIATR